MNNRYVDVLVSGSGPGGLAAAIAAVRTKKSVCVVSDRSKSFVRMQLIILESNERDYLRNLYPGYPTVLTNPDDKKFHELLDKNVLIPIKEIERYLLRMLLRHAQENQCIFVYNSELRDIYLSRGQCKVHDLETNSRVNYYFRDLICADGAHRHALKSIISPSQIIRVTDDNIQPHEINFNSYLSLQRKDKQPFTLPNELITSVFENHLVMIAFKKSSFEKSNYTYTKCMVGGEVPKSISDITDKEVRSNKIETYITSALRMSLQEHGLAVNEFDIQFVKKSRKYGALKDKLKFLIFNQHIEKSDKAVMNKDGHYLYLIGDNVYNLPYVTGYGLNAALRHAEALESLFQKNINVDQFQSWCDLTTSIGRQRILAFLKDKKGAAKGIEEAITIKQRKLSM